MTKTLEEQNVELRDQLLGAQVDIAKLRDDRERLAESLNMVVAERDGYKSALNLQRLFLASAEVREARAQYNHASCKLNRAELLEQIATAISRGHLPDNFHSKLREWSK